MPKVLRGPLGVNLSFPNVNQIRTAPVRSDITGWSANAARRNRQFLQSVDPDQLTGVPFALSLTTRDLPADAETWAKMVKALLDWLRRRGMLRYHWVTEWQERGAPHLHAMIFMDPDQVTAWFASDLEGHWCNAIAAPYRASRSGQHVVPVTSLEGWVTYLAKHAVRGVEHHQRAKGALPPGWTKGGRLWAKGGSWPTMAEALHVDDATIRRLARFIRRWQRSRAVQRVQAGQRFGNQVQVETGRAELRHLARCGSARRRPEGLRLALHLLRQGEKAGRSASTLEFLRDQVNQEREKAAEGHRRAAMVRGSSAMAPDRVTGPLLGLAMNHAEGFTAPWLTRAERLAADRERHLAEKAQEVAASALSD